MPEAGDAAIGAKLSEDATGGIITVNNCEIGIETQSSEAKAIDGDKVYLTDCKITAEENKQGASIHAKSKLDIKNCKIYQ